MTFYFSAQGSKEILTEITPEEKYSYGNFPSFSSSDEKNIYLLETELENYPEADKDYRTKLKIMAGKIPQIRYMNSKYLAAAFILLKLHNNSEITNEMFALKNSNVAYEKVLKKLISKGDEKKILTELYIYVEIIKNNMTEEIPANFTFEEYESEEDGESEEEESEYESVSEYEYETEEEN
jgi:hypothetical protein